MISPRFTFSGDKVRAETMRGFGNKVLGKLETSLAFRKLPTGTSRIRLDDGTIVTADVSYGITNVNIFAPGGEVSSADGGCLCGKFFSEGFVVGVTEVPGYEKPAQLYTIDVCQADGKQVTIYNAVAYDFTCYSAGDRVMVCLSLRDYICLAPALYYPLEPAVENHWTYSHTFGYMGNEQGYKITVKNDSGDVLFTDYGCDFLPPETDVNEYPCKTELCGLFSSVNNCCTMIQEGKYYLPEITRDHISVDTIISMELRLDESYVLPPDTSTAYSKFNAQIVPFDATLIKSELLVGFVTGLNISANTVDVTTVDRFDYETEPRYAGIGRLASYVHGVTITDVPIDMETMTSYLDEEVPKGTEAWKMFIPFAQETGAFAYKGNSLWDKEPFNMSITPQFCYVVKSGDDEPTYKIIGIFFNKFHYPTALSIKDKLLSGNVPYTPLLQTGRLQPIYDMYIETVVWKESPEPYSVMLKMDTGESFNIVGREYYESGIMDSLYAIAYILAAHEWLSDYYITKPDLSKVIDTFTSEATGENTFTLTNELKQVYSSGGLTSPEGVETPIGFTEYYNKMVREYFYDKDEDTYELLAISVTGYLVFGDRYSWSSTSISDYKTFTQGDGPPPAETFGYFDRGRVLDYSVGGAVVRGLDIGFASSRGRYLLPYTVDHVDGTSEWEADPVCMALTANVPDGGNFLRDSILEGIVLSNISEGTSHLAPACPEPRAVRVKPRGVDGLFYKDGYTLTNL